MVEGVARYLRHSPAGGLLSEGVLDALGRADVLVRDLAGPHDKPARRGGPGRIVLDNRGELPNLVAIVIALCNDCDHVALFLPTLGEGSHQALPPLGLERTVR